MPRQPDTTAHMRGGVRRRAPGGAWSYVLDLGPQPAQRCTVCNRRTWLGRERLEHCRCGSELRDTRERRQIVQGGFRTRQQAVDARADKTRTIREGTFVEPTKMTLAEYLRDRWLPGIGGENLKATTAAGYESMVHTHLIGPPATPHMLGMMQLQRLNRDAIRAHYALLAANGGKRRPDGLAAGSLRQVHAVLSRALSDAVESGLIARNPAKGVTRRMVKPESNAKALKAWDATQLAAFLASLRGDRLYPLWHLYAMTGLRRGEALALRWDDVDLARGTLSVSKSRVPVKRTVVESAPKSERGTRVVQIDPETVAVLQAHADAQLAELSDAEAWKERYIFTTTTGEPLDPNCVSRWFTRAVARAALPGISIHGLRHTHATLALRAGVHPKIVQERLGHSSIAITLDRYSHATAGMDAEAAVTVANLVKEGAR